MSHLSTQEVAQTRLLSKQFKDELQLSFPIFIFDQVGFLGNYPGYLDPFMLLKCKPGAIDESIEEFAQNVEATLSQGLNEMK